MHRDLKSFKLLYHHYYGRLCFFAREYLYEDTLSEDVVQDVFAQIWNKPPSVVAPEKLQSYLYTMVRNKCLNIIKTKRLHGPFDDCKNTVKERGDDQCLRIIKAEVSYEIWSHIESLPKRAKEVFKLSYLSQLREYEIAERLGISVNSVKTHKMRARKILQQELKGLQFDLDD